MRERQAGGGKGCEPAGGAARSTKRAYQTQFAELAMLAVEERKFQIAEGVMQRGTTFSVIIGFLLCSSLTYCIAEGDGDADEFKDKNGQGSENYFRIFAAHGIMAVIAWAFLSPIAVASAFLRSLFPNDWWFMVHLCCNTMSFVLVVTCFILAVVNIERQEMFSNPHFITGWVILFLSTLQVVVGYFRPHMEKNEEPLRVADVVTRTFKSLGAGSIRAMWEVAHKFVGLTLLALSLWQMDTGIYLFYLNFGVSYRQAYWVWIGCFWAVVLLLKVWAYKRWRMNRPQLQEGSKTENLKQPI